MFYPELSMIVNDLFSIELIEELDIWFASLPKSHKDKITVSKISIKFELDFNISSSLLDECCEIGLLEKMLAIKCPFCEHILKISNESNLYDDIANIDNCYCCEEDDLIFTSDDILVIYKLIKKPTNTPDKVKFLVRKITDSKNNNNINDNLTDLISKSDFNPNSLFYNPNEQQQKHLTKLFTNLTSSFDTTKEKGDALEDLVVYLLSLVKIFKVSKKISSTTNQFDLVIRNKLIIPGSIFNIIGTHSLVECKNEKKKPNNTYYLKLIGILRNTGTRFGILFSAMPATSTCKTIARDTFLRDEIIVINICKDQLSDIISKNLNVLDVIESKSLELKLDANKNLLSSELF